MHKTKFWMVFMQDGKAPVMTHPEYRLALSEAKRLSLAHQKPTFVMEAIAGWEPPSHVEPSYVMIPAAVETSAMRLQRWTVPSETSLDP